MVRLGTVVLGILTGFMPPTPAFAWKDSPTSVVEEKGVVREFYGVPLDLTIHALEDSKIKFSPGWGTAEGTYYPKAIIHAPGGIELVAAFSDEGDLYMLETSSPGAIGPRQISVGSSLAEVKRAWPEGRFVWGSEDGRYATFDTGARVYYQFSPDALPSRAWDIPSKPVVIDPNIKVVTIRVAPSNKEK